MEKLLEAIEKNNLKSVKKLLTDEKITGYLLYSAIDRGNLEIVKFLLEDGRIDPNFKNGSLLHVAIEKSSTASTDVYLEIVELLLKDGRVDPSADQNLAFLLATDGPVEITRLLLEDGRADPRVALHLACACGHTEIAKLLLKDGRVDPSMNDDSAIEWASYRGHFEIVRLLLEDERVDPSRNDHHALKLAREYRHVGVAKILENDMKKYPTFEIRRHDLVIDKKIEKLRIEEQILENTLYNLYKNYSKHTHIPRKIIQAEIVIDINLQMIGDSIRKLKRAKLHG